MESSAGDGICRKDLSTEGSTPISSTVRYGRTARVVPTPAVNVAEITSLGQRPPVPPSGLADVAAAKIQRRPILGGLIVRHDALVFRMGV